MPIVTVTRSFCKIACESEGVIPILLLTKCVSVLPFAHIPGFITLFMSLPVWNAWNHISFMYLSTYFLRLLLYLWPSRCLSLLVFGYSLSKWYAPIQKVRWGWAVDFSVWLNFPPRSAHARVSSREAACTEGWVTTSLPQQACSSTW